MGDASSEGVGRPVPGQADGKVLVSLAGTGVPGGAWILRALEALEARGARYHKRIPAVSEVSLERETTVRGGPVGSGGFTEVVHRHSWASFLVEPELSTEGLDGLRTRIGSLPPRIRGFRTRLGYAFPAREAEALEVTVLVHDETRWELQLGVDAGTVLDLEDRKASRARSLLLADLGEALYDVTGAPHGLVAVGLGLPSHGVGEGGWRYLGSTLVEKLGRSRIEAVSRSCFKSWELADGGWMLAPSPLDDPDRAAEEGIREALGPLRHVGAGEMGQRPWRSD